MSRLKLSKICIAMLIALPLAGCNGGGTAVVTGPEYNAMSAVDSYSGQWDSGFTVEAESAPDVISDKSKKESVYESELKIIKTGSMDIETKTFAETDAYIQKTTEEYGGLISQRSINGSPGYRSAYYTVRIPADTFDDFFYSVAGNCTVTYQSVESEDVTEQYVDLETRLQTNEKKYERLLELLDKAETLQDIYSIQSEISDVEYEINRIKGTLNSMSSKISYSTITLDVRETNMETVVDDGSFWSAFLAAWQNGWQDFTDDVGGFMIDLAYAFPQLVLFILFILFCRQMIRKLRKRKRTAGSEKKSLFASRVRKSKCKQKSSETITESMTHDTENGINEK